MSDRFDSTTPGSDHMDDFTTQGPDAMAAPADAAAADLRSLEPPSGLCELRSRVSSEELRRSLEAQGVRCFVLDLRGVPDKAALLEAWAESVDAPDWVGRNWDALEEAMRDLSWARAERYVVIVTGAAQLASADPKSWRTALDILRSAVAEWGSRGIPMLVLVRGMPPPFPGALPPGAGHGSATP